MTNLYLLDTNTVSAIFKNKSIALKNKLLKTPATDVCISSITLCEIRYGLAKNPKATQLITLVKKFLEQVKVLTFDNPAADACGTFRAKLQKSGKILSAMDMLIASHAIAVNAMLVTNDNAIKKLTHYLDVVDWMEC